MTDTERADAEFKQYFDSLLNDDLTDTEIGQRLLDNATADYDALLNDILRPQGYESWRQYAQALFDSADTLIEDAEADNAFTTADRLSDALMGNEPKAARQVVGEVIERLEGIKANSVSIPHNKFAMVVQNIVNAGQQTLSLGKKRRKPIAATCTVSCDDDKLKIKGNNIFDEYDFTVLNAIGDLMDIGNTVMTEAQIWRAMNGISDNDAHPPKQQEERILNAIQKATLTRAAIDCTEEIKAWKVDESKLGGQINHGEINANLLYEMGVKIVINQWNPKTKKNEPRKISAHKILRMPLHREYSALTGQIWRVKPEVLDIHTVNVKGDLGARLPSTENRVIIRSYLIKRIKIMQGSKKKKNGEYEINNRILLTTICAEMFKNFDPTPDQIRAIRESTEIMLKYWVHIGFIAGFTLAKQGNQIIGYDIDRRAVKKIPTP